MTRFQYITAMAFTLFSVVMTGFLLYLGILKQRLEITLMEKQKILNEKQVEINKGAYSQRLIQNISQDLVPMAGKKPAVQGLLSRYGINATSPSTTVTGTNP